MKCETALAALCVCACAGISGPSAISEDQSELAAAIKRWAHVDAERYSYDFQRLCYCSPEAIAKVHIEVVGGNITALTFAEDVYHRSSLYGPDGKKLVHRQGSKVPDEFIHEFDNIVFMMGEIEQLLAKQPPPYVYDAEYDSEIGIPCRVYVDMSGGAIDEEVEFVVSNFSFKSNRSPSDIGCAARNNKISHFSQQT